MGKGIILGIDFSMDFTQLAYVDDEGNPQSVCIGTEDNYMIPTVACYNSELKEWSAGEEALNKGRLEKSRLYEELPKLLKDDYNQDTIEIMSAYMAYLLKLTSNHCDGRDIKNIMITIEEVTPASIEILTETFVKLGFEADDIKIISHSESFVYYVLNQNKDIWINNVYFLNFSKYGFQSRRLSVVKGRKPHVAGVSVENLDNLITLDKLKENPQRADQILADYMEEKCKKHVVSGVYLSGEGFYEDDWEKTLEVVCRNRRVFKGNNLIVKGAAYGAKEFFHIATLSEYLISCKGRTSVKVTMAVKYKERDNTITLSNIGDYWYQARNKVECIMEEPTDAIFEIHDVINHRKETFSINLKEFPKRESKTTRIEVDFHYIEENKFEVIIKDLGFGDFFKSSGMTVTRVITLG